MMNQRRKRRNKKPLWVKKNEEERATSYRSGDADVDVSNHSPNHSPQSTHSHQSITETYNSTCKNHDLTEGEHIQNDRESHSSEFCQNFGRIQLQPQEMHLEAFLGNILSLPDDVIFVIFSFLSESDLCRLCRVCKRFNYLASKDCVWSHHAEESVLIQFPRHRSFHDRAFSMKEKCRIAPNWKDGKFTDYLIIKHKVRQIPWVEKSGQDLWLSTGNVIRCFRCQPNAKKALDKRSTFQFDLKHDVTRFVVKNDVIVAGSSDGSVHCWKTSGQSVFHHDRVHYSDTHCVDLTDHCVISGSKDGTCKIFPLHRNRFRGSRRSNSSCIKEVNTGERVWCLQVSPCQSFFVAGLAGCGDRPPLSMWSIERGEFLGHLHANFKRGAGVLDMKFESPNELFTCGYDTFIRLWDLRTDTCVTQWEEPYDSSLYCLETDGGNAFAVGTARHGMVRMWDKRKTEPVQFYYSSCCSSPVYSLAMDYGRLYAALDMGLTVMDFTG